MIDFVENSRVLVQVARCLKKIFYYEQGLISSQMKVTFLSDLLVYDFKAWEQIWMLFDLEWKHFCGIPIESQVYLTVNILNT